MNEEYQEEWLSAYLDDELTDEQRLVVEQRLAVDPAAQATLEDLQRIRSMVAKLPRSSRRDLKFVIPSELPGSIDEADSDIEGDKVDREVRNVGIENDSDGELEDFNDVPRLMSEVEEPRVYQNLNSNRNSRSVLGWIATAASILLVTGLGYFYWPSTGMQVANLDRNTAPSAANLEFNARESEHVTSSDLLESSPNSGEALGRSMPFDAPRGGEDQNTVGLRDRSEPAPLARRALPQMEADPIRLHGEESLATDSDDSQMKVELFSAAAPSQPMPPRESLDGVGGGGLDGGLDSGAKMGSALKGNLRANAPVAELPRAGLASDPQSLALSEKKISGANEYAKDKSQKETSDIPAPGVYFARSQSWMDEETQSSLANGENAYRLDQLAFGNNRLQSTENLQAGSNQQASGTEGLLMAAIKPEAASSPEFFQSIVTSNQLIAVEPLPGLKQLSPANGLSPNYSTLDGKLDAANAAPLTESPNTSANNLFPSQRFQMTMPNSPQGNSFVLFLNRDEASRILNQLQESGQVASQVWRIIKQPESDTFSPNGRNMPATAEQRNTDDGRTTGQSMNAKAESTINEKVILLLNGSPY